MITFSVVSPVYNAAKILPELIDRIENSLKPLNLDYEIILVDDGCKEGSWGIIEQYCNNNIKIIGIKLSRNFGQHSAISAGIDKSKGEYIIVMDCDLQDSPEEIPNLYNKVLEGYDIVLARREKRKDSYLKKLSSKCFYKTLEYLSDIEQDQAVANFGIYNHKVINAIKLMKEPIRFFPSMVKWVGFSKTSIEVKHDNRYLGKTSYNYKKLFNLAIDIILAYSIKPIIIVIKLGFFISFLSFIAALIYFLRWFFGTITVVGYTSIIISVCFFSGLIIAILGVIGLYVAKTFESAKNRPIYIIEKQLSYEN
jgi:glycosyltransferase involved in cell wall biosynthesis